jgi:hypothetical protein
MDPAKQREIASKGGKAAHEKGTAHEFTSEEARAAGRKGGAASRLRRVKHQADGHGSDGHGQAGSEAHERAGHESEHAMAHGQGGEMGG